jgi:hypothetical protein
MSGLEEEHPYRRVRGTSQASSGYFTRRGL